MSRYHEEIPIRGEGAQKKPYETPRITTFGSVEKLTQGVGGSHFDAGHNNSTKHGAGGS